MLHFRLWIVTMVNICRETRSNSGQPTCASAQVPEGSAPPAYPCGCMWYTPLKVRRV